MFCPNIFELQLRTSHTSPPKSTVRALLGYLPNLSKGRNRFTLVFKYLQSLKDI